MNWENLIIVYFISINLAGFFTMGLDKAKAKAHTWRISEKVLFRIAFLGGSVGIWAGMYYFRHKTKHWQFKFGMPLLVFVQVFLAFACFFRVRIV